MDIKIFSDNEELGKHAAAAAATKIKAAIAKQGEAAIILATGVSQFHTLKFLVEEPIAWNNVVMFHLDEYIGIPETHKASFRKYLKERFIDKIPSLKQVHLINGGANDAEKECQRLSNIINEYQIDAALIGIGENGHLAFNDPPADFETEAPYIVVELDQDCRQQQVDEGWFENIKEVPQRSISMSVKQILKSRAIICSVPDKRKAEAVKACVEGAVTRQHPASILQQSNVCTLYLDTNSSSLLDAGPVNP